VPIEKSFRTFQWHASPVRVESLVCENEMWRWRSR